MGRAARDHTRPPAEYHSEVEAFFGQLPPELFRRGVLLRHDLAMAFSDTGQFEDLLRRPSDPPWLDWHFAALDDWGVAESEARAQLERRLFLAMAFTFCAVGLRDSNNDGQRLRQALLEEAKSQLAQLFPESSPFWAHYGECRAAHTRAATQPIDWTQAAPPYADAHRRMADRLALTKLSAVALALRSDASRLAPLLDLFDQLNLCFEILRDALALRRDAHQHRLSYAMVRTLHAAGLAWEPATSPEKILGAAVLSGALRAIIEECLARLAGCRASARELQLPSLAKRISHVEEQFNALNELVSLKGGGSPRPGLPAVSFAPVADDLPTALAMAEAYLLSDRTFQESWEVQRRGLFGVAELAGRVFAPGLILEVLCRHRNDLAGDVSAVLDEMAACGYRYYPHPAVPPDADDLGLALRLCAHSADSERHRQQLQRPLRWMEANLAESGAIPCWFVRGVEGLEGAGQTSLWGNHCATVEANLILGLLAYDPAPYHEIIARAARGWLRRWLSSGLGANSLYTSSYALWTALRLLGRLTATPQLDVPADQLARALESALRRWRDEASHAAAPQEAAFLILGCLEQPQLRPLYNPGWSRLILRHQRYDGGWPAEPLFVTPTRGEAAAWYASRSVTSAYCYHALKRCTSLGLAI
jgi:hypothetical protein